MTETSLLNIIIIFNVSLKIVFGTSKCLNECNFLKGVLKALISHNEKINIFTDEYKIVAVDHVSSKVIFIHYLFYDPRNVKQKLLVCPLCETCLKQAFLL